MEETPEGMAAAAKTREALKRKRATENGSAQPEQKRVAVGPVTLSHEFIAPKDYVSKENLSPEIYGTMQNPVYKGKMAKEYPFKLDTFQEVSIACLERKESVLVSAHTSAGKTAVAEYAIAMAMRDNQKVVYTSPLKALSNQKFRELEEEFHDVGLMTGDVTVNPNANIMVMTTEILRSMLYRGSEIEREVAWVIFDEVHYMQDRERGVVWEETIIFLPEETRMVFLSATLSNSAQFAAWISHLRRQPCHVVYTDFRPTPLQHYAFPQGGIGLFLIKDEAGKYRSDNFDQMHATFKAMLAKAGLEEAPTGGIRGGRSLRGRGRGRAGGRGGPENGSRHLTSGKRDQGDVAADIVKILKMTKLRQLEPVIIFSFARRECEFFASRSLEAQLDFNSEEEKEQVQLVFDNALQCLSDDDRNLDAIQHILPLMRAGIGVHHSGLLPILKELTELLFSEQLLKVLFATETFAMGLNMPARTVVFSNLQKWDGQQHRFMSSGEYIQMSGRAGRRGKDDRGLCILMVDDQLTSDTCKQIVMGQPSPLMSSFKLTYYTLLNLMRRMEGSGQDMEYVIKRSFQQFQFESELPKLRQELTKIEEESSGIKVTSQGAIMEFLKFRKEIRDKEQIILHEVLRPERCIQFLRPGRLIRVRDRQIDWGWGILVRYRRTVIGTTTLGTTSPAANTVLPARENLDAATEHYVLDVLLACSPSSVEAGVPQPAKDREDADMQVVPVPLGLITAMATLRVSIPPDLRPAEHRKATLLTIRELQKRFPDGLPRLDPIEDFGIKDSKVVNAALTIERLEKELAQNEVFKMEKGSDATLGVIERKAELETRAEELRLQMRGSQLNIFRSEARNRTAVLRRLGHVDSQGIVLSKGRAACEIDTADELLTTELMFNGVFSKLDKHQIAALASCLVPIGEKSAEMIRMKTVLAEPLSFLQETARHIAAISNECKLEVNEDEYVDSFQPTLMDVVHAWSKGSNFKTICEMTDIFEGSIIRFMRRLDEFLSQLIKAANVVGEASLAAQFEESVAAIRRDIVFSASLYL